MKILIGLNLLFASLFAQAATYTFLEVKVVGTGVGLEKLYDWTVANSNNYRTSSIWVGQKAYEIARALGVSTPEQLTGKTFESNGSLQETFDQLSLQARYNGNYVSPSNEEIATYIVSELVYGRCGSLESISETDAVNFGYYLTMEKDQLDESRVARVLEGQVDKVNKSYRTNYKIKIQKTSSSRFNQRLRAMYMYYYEAIVEEQDWQGKTTTKSVLFRVLPGMITPVICN